MPPRFVYWTILIDGKPTAFRARDQQELLPTMGQLKRTNQDVVMKWFARGKLWDSPEAERAADRRPAFTREKRGADWRPGGTHKDPRDRFKKKNRPERAWSDQESPTRRDRDKLGPPADRERRPFTPRPGTSPRDPEPRRSTRDHRSSEGGWSKRPQGPPKPWNAKPQGPRKPWGGKPDGPRKPWGAKPDGPRKPWGAKPDGPRKPWHAKPPIGGPRRPSPDHRADKSGPPQDRPARRKPDEPDKK